MTLLLVRVAELERWRAQQQAVPGVTPQPAAGEFDAWARYNRREPQRVNIGTPGRPGGGGDDPSGSGGSTRTGLPGSGGRPAAFSDEQKVNYAKLLDEKMTGTDLFKYAGGDGAAGEKWRKAVRGYVGTNAASF